MGPKMRALPMFVALCDPFVEVALTVRDRWP